MKTNLKDLIEQNEYKTAIEHLADRGITATLREDKKIVCEQADYERAVATLDKAYKWGEINSPMTVTTLLEHYSLESIVKRFPAEIKQWRADGDLSDDLFHALYDYYFDEMPYGTKKARDGDPYEWVSNRLDQDLGHDVEESSPVVPTAGADLEEGNGAHMFVMGDTVYYNNREGRVDRQEGNKVFVHKPNGDMDVWPADETSLTRQGELNTMRKHISDIGRGLKGFMTGRPELEESEDLEEKAKNPYAVGMAVAKKKFGYGEEPEHNLPKKVVMKAHEIAKKVDAKESVQGTVTEGSAHGYNVVKWYEKHGDQKKLTNWLKKQAGLPKDAHVYFDDADLVLGDKTIVPNALVNPKLKFVDLLNALHQAHGKAGMEFRDNVYREIQPTEESVELDVTQIKRLSGLK